MLHWDEEEQAFHTEDDLSRWWVALTFARIFVFFIIIAALIIGTYQIARLL